jgi:hypothetical protein
MATYINNSSETFVFPSLALTVEPGDTFESADEITTSGIELADSKKAKDKPVADPAPVAPADAPETPATPEESK